MLAPRGTGLVVYKTTSDFDGIEGYSHRLVEALVRAGTPAEYVSGTPAARRHGGDPPWILLQYCPISYGRRGIAPGLLRDAVALRHRTAARLAICVHESWTHVHDWRSALMAAYHRAQLMALLRLSDVMVGVTETITRRLGHGAIHIPVGSNIDPLAITRLAARRSLGLADELVVTLFGTGRPVRALDHAEAAIAAIAGHRGAEGVRVLNLGANAPRPSVPLGVVVDSPGCQEADELSLRLHASDIALLPFVDGVSTRRTTLMAALAHGLPVAGTRAKSTDRVLIDHPEALLLTPVGQPGTYARAVLELISDCSRLRGLGDCGQRLYEQCFDWPVLAQRVTAALDGH